MKLWLGEELSLGTKSWKRCVSNPPVVNLHVKCPKVKIIRCELWRNLETTEIDYYMYMLYVIIISYLLPVVPSTEKDNSDFTGTVFSCALIM